MTLTIRTVLRGALLGAALVFGACGPASSQDGDQGEDGLTYHSAEDAAMVEAIASARKTLPDFWAAMDSGNANYSDFAIKHGMKTDDDSIEHIWISNLKHSGGSISGTLENDPVYISGANLGDVVRFTNDEVTDWTFRDKDKMRGHYTTRVLIKSWPKEQADGFLAILSETP
ncbi:MAG: DUF2314 domain-containing protein [Alphaproteobacteria bacterium]